MNLQHFPHFFYVTLISILIRLVENKRGTRKCLPTRHIYFPLPPIGSLLLLLISLLLFSFLVLRCF